MKMQLPQKVGLAGLGLAIVGIAFGWAIFPVVLNSQIAKIKGLARGSESRELWEKVPFALDFKVYLFNTTNYRSVQELGDTPMLDEIGPYHFDEWKEKVDLVDYEQDDSVSFNMKNTFIFNKEKSAPLTGQEIIAAPHVLLMGVLNAVERAKPGVLGMVNSAIPSIFNGPATVFYVGNAMDFLFNGMVVNCTSKDFYTVAVCSVMKKELKDIMATDVPNLYKFSVFGSKNATADLNRFKVSRGINDASNVGKVMTINGKKKLPFWRGRPCNDLQGTDSTVFPPSIKKEEPLWSYSLEICRSLPAHYSKPSNYKGIDGLRFEVSLGDMSSDPSLKCFCVNDTFCMKKGTMDLMTCTGAPVMASLPHFLGAHEFYQKGVRGLHPNKEAHEIVFDIEPMTGTPLYAKKRLMISMPLHKVKSINLTQNLPDTYVPMFWVEESLELTDEFVEKVDTDLFRIIRIVDISKWSLIVSGCIVMVAGVGLHYKRKNALAVTPTSTSTKRTESPDHYLDSSKKTQGLELDAGHTNYGYI